MAKIISSAALCAYTLGLSLGGLTGCSPDTTVLAYVASSANNHVQVIDLKNGNSVGKIYSGAAPWRLVQAPDHKSLWVQHWYSETTAVVDLASHEIKQVLPYRGPGAFLPDNSQFVTYSWPLPDLHVINAQSFDYIEKRATEISRVYDLIPRSDGKGFWMTRFDPVAKGPKERHSYVLFLPYKKNEHIETLPASFATGLSPTRIVNSARHPFSITTDSDTNGISLVNVLGDVNPVPACPAPQAVVLAPDEKHMVVACWEGYGVRKSEIVVYRTDFSARPWPSVEPVGSIKVDGAFTAARFHPRGESVVLVDRINHQLVEFSVSARKIVKTWPTGELPSDVELVTVTSEHAHKLASTETTGRQLLKKVLAKMQAARTPFTEVAWVETRSAARHSSLMKTAEQPQKSKKEAAAPSMRLQNYLKGPGRLRTEAGNGIIRLVANGTSVSLLPDGRFWVTPRQELLPLVLGLPALNIDDAVRHLAGDVPGSLEMRSGLAVDVVTEVKDGHHSYFVIGTLKGGERVPQLWVDADTGLPTNMADKFPVLAARSGHEQTDFNGTVETKLYDFTQQNGKYGMPARMERVIDGKFMEEVKVEHVKTDPGIHDSQFDLARLGSVARKPKSQALFSATQAVPKATPVAAVPEEEYLEHPFQEHAPYTGNPPVRGAHLKYIADWGVHNVPIPLELQLHNLKDGGVALQYNCPEGCPEVVAELKKIAAGFDKFTLVAPYPLMDAKIALTAWGKLETLESVDTARITEFIKSNIGINHHAH